ncbi:MAG TPA: response regulator [Polyangiaceae bacterium]|nr:response regulator [Polyangiaceae bacterium]
MAHAPEILLVEDDPAHAELARRGLQTTPLTLHTVETLAAAKEWIRSHVPDVVLSDLRLPDGSALELLASGVPLVVMTSQGDERRAVDAMKGGALDYVVKSPEMYRDLPVIVERALRSARAERDRLRAEASLRESEERFRQLADSIEQAFWLYDFAERRMVYTSPAFERVYKVRPDPGGGAESRLGAVHPDDRAGIRALSEASADGAPSVQEFRVRSGDQIAWVEERTFPIEGPDGRPFRVAGLGQDVSRRRELEAALRQSHKMQAVGQLAGGIAHDFNNMLAAILASGDHLRTLTDVPEQRELCELIVSAAERAAELTQKLLSFSRKGKIASNPVDVHGVVREATMLLSRSIDRRVRIVTDMGAMPTTVIGDAAQLQNALLNLGINARDAMPSGGELRISTAIRDLDEGACAAMPFEIAPGRYVQISVRDTGTGIAPENLGRVFEPFFTTKPVGQGTGLGLAAVYGTVVEHGGAVMVYSEVGRGTVFHLYLPLSESAPAPRETTSHPPRGQGLVLLVDDEPLVRSVGQRLLESLGYDVVVAKDGAEGVRVFENSHDRLVAVLCDLVMPVLSGGDATTAMKRIDPLVPILMCSGFSRDDRAGDVPPATDAFLAKPFHLAELASALSRVARKPPGAEPGAR